jgi:hypothetical protein
VKEQNSIYQVSLYMSQHQRCQKVRKQSLKFIFCPKYSPIYENFRFTAAILDFRLNGLSDRVGVSTIEKFDPENMGVAAGILFLSALELEIHLGGNSTPPPGHLT